MAHNLIGSPPSSCVRINSPLGLWPLLHYSGDIKWKVAKNIPMLASYKDAFFLPYPVISIPFPRIIFSLIMWVGSHHRKCVLQIIVLLTTEHQNRLSEKNHHPVIWQNCSRVPYGRWWMRRKRRKWCGFFILLSPLLPSCPLKLSCLFPFSTNCLLWILIKQYKIVSIYVHYW